MTRRVLVTRPEPGATATAQRLIEMGFTPVILPLTRIAPIVPERLPDADNCDAVVVTSVNAIRHAPSGLIAALSSKPVFAVGDASAQAAREAGFADVRSASGTAVDLAALMGEALPRGVRILHLAGAERTEGFSEALAGSGFAVDVLELYRAEKVSYVTDFQIGTFADGDIWGALAMSARGGTLLAELVVMPGVSEQFEKTCFFCISEKVALPLRALKAGKVLVAGKPTEDAVLELVLSQG